MPTSGDEESRDFTLLETDEKSNDDISKTNIRYYMLFLACFLCFGNYFIYDNPSALQTQLEDVIFI
jgi:hypothetical protein